MITGKSEFPLQINPQALTEIVELIGKTDYPDVIAHLSDIEADYQDIQVARTLLALQTYMNSKHIDPGFEVVFE